MGIHTHSYTCMHTYPKLHTCTHYTSMCSHAGIVTHIHGHTYLFAHVHKTWAPPTHVLTQSCLRFGTRGVFWVTCPPAWGPPPHPRTHPSVHMGASLAAPSSCILMPSTVRCAHRSEKQLPLFVYFSINKSPAYQTLRVFLESSGRYSRIQRPNHS